MWKIWILIGFIGISSSLVGCNMLKGAGEDIEKTGDKIQDAAS